MEEPKKDRPESKLPEHLEQLTGYLNWLVYIVLGLMIAPFFIVYGFPELSFLPKAENEPVTVVAESSLINPEDVVDGIHLPTGFVADDGLELMATQCTACHSSKLVIQNRATREGWLETIRWMQETQKLWDLGDNEGPILDYLAKHYAPVETGRRKPLVVEEWYEIE